MKCYATIVGREVKFFLDAETKEEKALFTALFHKRVLTVEARYKESVYHEAPPDYLGVTLTANEPGS